MTLDSDSIYFVLNSEKTGINTINGRALASQSDGRNHRAQMLYLAGHSKYDGATSYTVNQNKKKQYFYYIKQNFILCYDRMLQHTLLYTVGQKVLKHSAEMKQINF